MTTRQVGMSTLTVSRNDAAVARRLVVLKAQATLAMAEEAKLQANEVFTSDGDGRWAPNQPSTVQWKGHDKVMLGRTGTLSDSIGISPAPVPGNLAVGWAGNQHPDSHLSDAELALLHEMDRPWLSQVADNPRRSEPVLAAGMAVYRSL